MSEQAAIVACKHCNQWGAVYTQCKTCGAPIEPENPDENYSPLIVCSHCQQFGIERTQCKTCGAPMPKKLVYYDVEPSPYWGSGGMSLGKREKDDNSFWAQ